MDDLPNMVTWQGWEIQKTEHVTYTHTIWTCTFEDRNKDATKWCGQQFWMETRRQDQHSYITLSYISFVFCIILQSTLVCQLWSVYYDQSVYLVINLKKLLCVDSFSSWENPSFGNKLIVVHTEIFSVEGKYQSYRT